MATHYRIEVAYNSAHNSDNVWEVMKSVIDEIQKNPRRIIKEVFRIEPDADRELIKAVAEYYRKPVRDLTININEREDGRSVRQRAEAAKVAKPRNPAVVRCVVSFWKKCTVERWKSISSYLE